MNNDYKLFHDRYFLERLLGCGGFSEVWLAKDTKTDASVALKIFAPSTGVDDDGIRVFAHEFSLVANVHHKNLLTPSHYDSFDRKPYLVLPYCKKGSIVKVVGQFNEEQAWSLLRDVASGLACLHSMKPPIVHQDIKPDNIMVDENDQYMITDFGVSARIRSTLRKSMSTAFYSAGTRAYMAPERFGSDVTPNVANDIYSLGATVFEMLSGYVPFGEEGGLVHQQCINVPVLRGDFSKQLKKTINKCLALNPWERPTAEQLEKWAETALEGKKIHFGNLGKKTFGNSTSSLRFRKYVWIGVGVFAVALAAGLVLKLITLPKEPTLEALAQKDLPIYVQKANICDSLIDLSDNGTVEQLLEAKRILSELKCFEAKYASINKEYNKSKVLENALNPKLKSASQAWASSANIQEALADKQRAEEMRKTSRALWDEDNKSTEYINIKNDNL